MQKITRLKRELEKISKNPPPGVSCFPRNDDLTLLDASVMGQPGSPYENGIFKVEIQITDKYPFQPPCLRFMTRIYHPNIDDQGRICLDLLKLPPSGGWRPTVTIEGLLVALQFLLSNPNPEDPLMADIAEEYSMNKEQFKKKAIEFTKKYACSNLESNSTEGCTDAFSIKLKRELDTEETQDCKRHKLDESPK